MVPLSIFLMIIFHVRIINQFILFWLQIYVVEGVGWHRQSWLNSISYNFVSSLFLVSDSSVKPSWFLKLVQEVYKATFGKLEISVFKTHLTWFNQNFSTWSMVNRDSICHLHLWIVLVLDFQLFHRGTHKIMKIYQDVTETCLEIELQRIKYDGGFSPSTHAN